MLISMSLFAQEQKVLTVPEKYLFPTENVELPKPNDILSDQSWFVWSDRSNNPVFLTSDGNEKIAEAAFGEKFAVLGIQGNRLRLAKIDDIVNGMLQQGKQYFGWVDADKLVLWNHCLITDCCKKDKKAMVFNFVDSNNSGSQGLSPNFYNGAGSNYESLSQAGTGIARMYFVYKETGDYLLLGRSSNFINTELSDVVDGWIPKRYCSIWSTNLALEINWYPEAVNERENNINNVLVWENQADAASLSKEGKWLFRENHMYQERTNGFRNRFLLLEQNITPEGNIHNQPIKVGLIGDISKMDQDEVDWEKLLTLTDGLEKTRNINILFVVDASKSMEGYSVSVANALHKAMDIINEKNNASTEQNQFRFGAVLFRDEAEENIVHIFGSHFTGNINELGQWVQTYMTPQYNRYDIDTPEALYFGINQALETYSPNPNETNYLIVIGDAGDHQNPEKVRTFINEEQIIDNLVKYNMNMLAYQLHRPVVQSADNPYQDFENQVKRIMLNSANKSRNQMNIDTSEVINFETTGDNFFKLNSQSPVIGAIFIETTNATTTVQQLETYLIDAIERINDQTTKHLKELIKVLEGSSNIGEMPQIIDDLIKSGMGIQDIKIILSGGLNQVYQEGYTLLQPENASYPWFQYVLLIEKSDLHTLKSGLSKLIRCKDYSPPQRRKRLIYAWEEILIICNGNHSNIELRQSTARDLSMCMTCLPGKNKFLNVKLSDLQDPVVVSDKDINEFIRDFEETLQIVDKILNMGTEYPSISDPESNEIYFWIPTDIFPHD